MWIWSERFSAPVGRSDRPHMGPKKSLRRCVSQTLSDVRWCRPGCLSAALRPRPDGVDSEKWGARILGASPKWHVVPQSWCLLPSKLAEGKGPSWCAVWNAGESAGFPTPLAWTWVQKLVNEGWGRFKPCWEGTVFKRYWKEVDASVSSENACFFFFFRSFSRQAVAFLLDCRGNDLV